MADGYFYLVRRMTESGIIDGCDVILDGGDPDERELCPGVTWRVVHSLESVRHWPGPLIWVRGGFKPTDVYQHWKDAGKRIIFYAANTGRERWPFWSDLLDDLTGRDYVDHRGVRCWNFRKPINEEIFYFKSTEPQYDLCIGGSMITDKKGQHRVMGAVARDMPALKCVMPGGIRHGVQSSKIMDVARKHRLAIHCPGMVSRRRMADVYRSARVMVHAGSGQHDRSVLEALACGRPVVIDQPQYHPPWLRDASEKDGVFITNGDLTGTILRALGADVKPADAALFRRRESGMDEVILPFWRELLS